MQMSHNRTSALCHAMDFRLLTDSRLTAACPMIAAIVKIYDHQTPAKRYQFHLPFLSYPGTPGYFSSF